jgi:hypothetical protein
MDLRLPNQVAGISVLKLLGFLEVYTQAQISQCYGLLYRLILQPRLKSGIAL